MRTRIFEAGPTVSGSGSEVPGTSSLLDESSGNYRGNVRRLSGRGTAQPGYRIIGSPGSEGRNSLADARVVKVVSPLTGQGPADPRDTGRYANFNADVISPRRMRVSRYSPANTGSVVVRPPRTAIRRLDNSGAGVVGEF